MEWNAEEFLKTKHTKVLLNYMKTLYKVGGSYDITENHSGAIITTEQVKKELSTREHIPNKKEAKEIRQNKAKIK